MGHCRPSTQEVLSEWALTRAVFSEWVLTRAVLSEWALILPAASPDCLFSLTCPAVPLESELPGLPLRAFSAGLGLDPKLLSVLPKDAGLALGLPLALH